MLSISAWLEKKLAADKVNAFLVADSASRVENGVKAAHVYPL